MASFSPSAWARPHGHLTMIFLGISSSGLGSSLGREITGKRRLLWLGSQLVQLHSTALARNYFDRDFEILLAATLILNRRIAACDTLGSQH